MKRCKQFLTFPKSLAVGLLTLSLSFTATAEDEQSLAMRNATNIVTMLDGVLPEYVDVVLDNLKTGKLQRVAPKQPVWIISTLDESILFYQGQPSFVGKSAMLLVDDAGQRFGLKAIQKSKESQSSWMSIQLGDKTFRAFCRSQIPFIACSMIL